MKSRFYVILFLAIGMMVSCTKGKSTDKVDNTNNTTSDPPLEGNWKMILYIDSSTGITENIAQSYVHTNVYTGTFPYPPAGDVKMKIVFNNPDKTQGTITGTCIMNGCSLGFNSTAQRSFAKTSFARTLAVDPPWGEYFLSYLPLTNYYSFDGDSTLRMQLPTKTLVFKRE